jgi:ketosteroid isomerase-like protein
MTRPSQGLLILLACACTSSPEPPPTPSPPAISQKTVEALLEDQRQAWNRGDWAGFIAGYWDHPQLTFNGATGITRGRKDLLQQFQEGYPDAATRGVLTFHDLELRPLGSNATLVLGRYQLDRATPASGYFSLVVEQTPQGVKITHDHTSESPPPKDEHEVQRKGR